MNKKDLRLSEKIVPENYALEIEPSIDQGKFSGIAIVDIIIEEENDKIIMHAADLDIKKSKVLFENSEIDHELKKRSEEDLIELNLERKLKGKVVLEFQYSGNISDNLKGIYKSNYESSGKKKSFLTTQFEAPYARYAFPCFDEPLFKATFDICLLVDKDLKAVSNMPIEEEKEDGDKKKVYFERTKQMSTYLLYLGVGDFDFLEDKYGDVDLRLIAVDGKSERGKMALDFCKKFLKYFEKYSGIKYPLPKLDLIAVPDFSAGAMENWGAITFREVLLLADENTSFSLKKRVAEVIAHELWHQWSGNLVTMKWWNDLWLNESFANYMAYKAIEDSYPEWNIMEDFVLHETNSAMSLDYLKSTHSISAQVDNVQQIEEIFDAISYAKGGNVLRMVESFMGEEEFRKGVSDYLKEFEYKNAEAKDLWENLSKYSKENIVGILEDWVSRKGYPVISARRTEKGLRLSQERFVNGGSGEGTWKIPVVIDSNVGEKRILLDSKENEIEISDLEWFKVNSGRSGFYRVDYDISDLEIIGSKILKKEFEEIDRQQINTDLFALCLSGKIPLKDYLSFLRYFQEEDSYLVLANILAALSKVNFVFYDSLSKEEWKSFFDKIRKPFDNLYQKLGWESDGEEPEEANLIRAISLAFLILARDDKVLKEGEERFEKYLKTGEVESNVSGPIFSSAALKPGNYGKLKKAYESEDDLEIKLRLLGCLYLSEEDKNLEDSLEYIFSDNVRLQDRLRAFIGISGNPIYREIYFKWVKNNWTKFENLKEDYYTFRQFIVGIVGLYVSEDMKGRIEEFFDEKDVDYGQAKENAFEDLGIAVKWKDRNEDSLKDFLNSN